jgi:NADH-quinone oxidoreductase subunit N
MMKATDMATMLLIATSLVVLMLEAIGNRNTKLALEKPHIRLLVTGVTIVSLSLLFYPLIGEKSISKKPLLFISDISSIFLTINTLISIFLTKKTLKNQNGEIYFLIVAALAISIANVCTTSLILKMVTSTSWLVLMAALSVRSTQGGKKAEIGLKLAFFTIITIILFLLAIFFLTIANYPVDLELITLSSLDGPIGLLGLTLVALAGLALSGTPPFHFAHIDCADGSNISVAFLFLSNSIIQGCLLLFQVKSIFVKSGFDGSTEVTMQAVMLILGFMVLWLRALDQSKIRRTAAYIATSVGPLFSMSLLFGTSILLPKLIFLLALYSFTTLTLFTLYGSLAYMGPVNFSWHTWEDMSGFGRLNPWQTLTFLVALSSITGLPGTLGYFVKLSLIAPFKDSIMLSGSIFLSIAIGAACTMRVFVFAYSKHPYTTENALNERPHITVMAACLVLIVLGFFPFVR